MKPKAARQTARSNPGGQEMLKFLITTLALAVFAMTFTGVEARAEYRPCVKAPKDYLPCPMTAQRLQFAKPRTR
jgi:hypothetical protein